MTKTAVEWLVEKHFGGIDNCTPDFRYHIKQAKEMERQQIIDAVIYGNIQEFYDATEEIGNDYYNQNYNK
jgi:hypothetical protein